MNRSGWRLLDWETLAIATITSPTAIAAITELTSGGLATFAGSALVGYIIGFALKKIVKWNLIILGVLAGIIFITIQWMANNGYIEGINWDKLGNDISSYGQHHFGNSDRLR